MGKLMESNDVLRLFGNEVFKINPETAERVNSIWQLSDMPNLVIDGEGDNYIGYEHIGDAYSGSRRHIIQPRDAETSKLVAEYVKDGILLDIGCGDGVYTVPCAKLGMKIIAGDISNKMLSILKEKAEINNVSLDKVVLCRMNALDIPIKDESVDCVIANSMLHLISNPEKVVDEIRRVLKKGGAFLCFDDAPGKNTHNNTDYSDTTGELYCRYWEYLQKNGINEKKYRWSFDRNGYCETKFSKKEDRTIRWNVEYEEKVEDYFLPRLTARGFSAQTTVPEKEHKEALQYAFEAADKRFGKGWEKRSARYIIGDILVTVFIK